MTILQHKSVVLGETDQYLREGEGSRMVSFGVGDRKRMQSTSRAKASRTELRSVVALATTSLFSFLM
jgi:hypothetical protein